MPIARTAGTIPQYSVASSCSTSTTAAKAVNGSLATTSDKWCSAGTTKWLKVDLGSSANIKWFTLKHAGAGGESAALDTKAFNIQVSTDNSTWSTVVKEAGNTRDVTSYPTVPKSSRYVRVNITTPTSSTDTKARIYELEVYR